MRGNPTDKTVAKKAYASAQYSEVMDINRFAEHIASHGCVYKRSDIVAILTMSVDCMREQLLAGQKSSWATWGVSTSASTVAVRLLPKGIQSGHSHSEIECELDLWPALRRIAGGGGIQSGGNPKCSPCRGESLEGRQDYRGLTRNYRRR